MGLLGIMHLFLLNPDDPGREVSADCDRFERYEEGRSFRQEKIDSLEFLFTEHVWGEVADANHGLFRPGKPVPHAFARYRDISTNMLGQGFVRYWDDSSSVPYLYNAEKRESLFPTEDSESLGLKCKYVLDHKLGGIMFWEYGGDSGGTLLDAIDEGLRQKQAAAVPVK